MPHESIRLPLEEIVRLLQHHEVRFVVIGGQAESLMGSPRVTNDVDLCYLRSSDNIARLAEALTDIRPRLRGAPADLPFRADAQTIAAGLNFTFSTDLGDLDLLGEVSPIGNYEALLARAETYRTGDLVVQTIALEDLIRVKESIKRVKDVDSLCQLLAIKKAREMTGLS